MESWDPNTKSALTQIPLLSTRAGPRDGAAWTQRLKEEYRALIAYTAMNKSNDNDWFRISASDAAGTRWTGKCWYVHNLRRYEFDLQFDVPVTYPSTAPEIELPQLDGKTHKMYRGGKICLTVHFKPLWAKNCGNDDDLCLNYLSDFVSTLFVTHPVLFGSPRFGIAHALCLGLAPWLAAEVPVLVDSGMVKHKDDISSSSES
ncbi:Ubiquitin-fold modifier-conjugating enzyme 1 [Acorus gramineus]|uniref:Ubiquitin-fold modifier-conjugating enzyme 1 n=1 Tax=Acorus gramineus TaxID=55184 RepID=A0AAV9BJX1_ACOGR|nr:Ubiquitin-fold modifier-conjugating enzyme 1 [Acorus gramineus]